MKCRPFLSQALSNPTTREMLLHFAADLNLALTRRIFQIYVFKIRVLASKIYEFIKI